jgi:carbamoyl-phosphate synthase small subunit
MKEARSAAAPSERTGPGIVARGDSADAALVLADGTAFPGRGLGAPGRAVGEICFNTAITGYQEILTDPSYAGQIITFTFPHVGNVGTNPEDIETATPAARGLVLRVDITEPSNWRATRHLDAWLKSHNLVGIAGIDTRALTRRIRDLGAPEGCAQTYSWDETGWRWGEGYGRLAAPKFNVVAVDYGAKRNILRCLADLGCRVTVVPATATAEDILRHQPDGVFLSNGPGDPAATGVYAVPVIKALLAEKGLPIFGICLGHQMLALALGARTKKMHLGHHGANHPVKDLATGRVEITSQNHGFVVDPDSFPAGVEATHVSLFDGTNEGLRVKDRPVFSVQHHPEASPGPQDSHYLFQRFVANIETRTAAR